MPQLKVNILGTITTQGQMQYATFSMFLVEAALSDGASSLRLSPPACCCAGLETEQASCNLSDADSVKSGFHTIVKVFVSICVLRQWEPFAGRVVTRGAITALVAAYERWPCKC